MYMAVRFYALEEIVDRMNLSIQILPPPKSPLKFMCTAECTYCLYLTAHDVLTS